MAESGAGRGLPGEGAMRAWQDGVSAMFRTFAPGAVAGSAPSFPSFPGMQGFLGLAAGAPNNGQAQQTFGRIMDGTRELTGAQIAVATDWVRLPFTLATGQPGGLQELQQSYARLFRAYNTLFQTYVTAAAPAHEAAMQAVQQTANQAAAATRDAAQTVQQATTQAATTTQSAVRTGARAVQQVAESANAAGASVERAARAASNNSSHVAATAVDEAIKVAEAAEKATAPSRPQAEQGAAATEARRIKGNLSSRGEKIYHLPGQASYERTQAEELFDTEAEAQAAGYRRAETRGGGSIKGKINRDGKRIYHLPGQANYDRFDADFLFETEEQAHDAGFRPSQR